MATAVMKMKMALASDEDLSAAYELLGLLDSVDRGYYPAAEDEEGAPMFLDEDDPDHLRRIHARLKEILGRHGSGAMLRVIGGFSTLRSEKNQFLDLTKDTVELHPRIIKALELEAAMRDKSAPPAVAALPPFPVSLRKMWSGGEVQRWIDENIAPVARTAPRAGVPAGWKLVPIEPTEDMIVDGFESWPAEGFSEPEVWEAFEKMSGCQQAAHKARLCYSAMLNAAPAAGEAVTSIAWTPAARSLLGLPGAVLTNAARDVLAERERQVKKEGRTPEHDDQYRHGEMSSAAAAYAAYTQAYPAGDPPPAWPWPAQWWKPTIERRNRVKAAALLLADIERIDRAAARAAQGSEGGEV
jgi:hypothetical protein